MAKLSKKPSTITNLPQVTVGGIAVARVFSISMLIVAIAVIGVLFFQVMASFFVPLFLAALLVVIFRPVHAWILERLRGRNRIASILTTVFIILLVLLPAGLIISVAAAQGASFFRQLGAGGITQSLERMRKGLSLDLPSSNSFRQLNQDVQLLAEPLPVADAKSRIHEAEDILGELQAEIGATTASDRDAAKNAFSQFVTDLKHLSERTERMAELMESEDSLSRERARKAYDVQYLQLTQSHQAWTRAILGNSLLAQLKLAANPSDMEVQSLFDSVQAFLQPRVLPLTQRAGQFVFQTLVAIVILVISLYFFFADGSSMVQTMMRLSPLDDEYERRLLMQFDQTSRAVVLASVLSALAQGTLAAIGFWFAGLPSVVFLFIATTFMGLVPFLGAASVWVPCVIYLATVEHRMGAAIGLAIFGMTIISWVDNLIKVAVLQGHSQIHPLLALLSVLGGLQVFGPIGILVGPMVVVFMQTLLEILNHELEGRTPPPVDTSVA
ncbi:MAG: AI-2E family transporter [Planctomycetaceae bacterium]